MASRGFGRCTWKHNNYPLGLSISVATYLEKAAEHEIGWPLPAGMDAKSLEQLLFAAVETPKSTPVIPNWQEVATEIQAHNHP